MKFFSVGFLTACVASVSTFANASPDQELLACYPKHNVLKSTFQVPEGFDAKLVTDFQTLAQAWNKAYRAKVHAANNGLVSDLQKEGEGCFQAASAVSLDDETSLKDALKECVFTDINAYSTPAISPDDQETLAVNFVQAHEKDYKFYKLVNASLQNDPITAFNTSCVLEIRPKSLDEQLEKQRLYLAGYTID